MARYQAPLREINFVLNDILDAGRLTRLPGFSEATPDVLSGLVEEAARLLEEQLAPLSAKSDAGCTFQDGEVIVPEGFKPFYKLYRESGWVGLAQKTEYGGQGLPYTLGKVVEEMVSSANVAFTLYPALTASCFEAIEANGSEEQKKIYLPRLATGEWTGTMCMTEPQAGSDIGAVKTRAYPQADGRYRLEGTKIFISSGEHQMADNIVHFVLARLPDSPPGVKGLSTFIVPKFLLSTDGLPGARNTVRCLSIEHKMGLHGSCTCTLAFENAKGWRVGEPNQGIHNMFVMMNMARIMVGVQGLGQCELATQNAIRYAQERRQGKAASGGETLIEHPDVRRMLLTMKAMTEGARVLAYETGLYVDLSRHHPDAAVRQEAQDWVDLNTPLVKAFCTDAAVELAALAIQVYGGHGYIREHGIEQILRDSKILCLYEGTNGIQAMDLVRRKLTQHEGRLPRRFFERVRNEIPDDAPLRFIAQPLLKAVEDLEATTLWMQDALRTRSEDAAFGGADFLRAFALTYLGYNWLRMSRAALRHADAGFAKSKRVTAEFFVQRLLPQVHALCGTVRNPTQSLMSLSAANF